MANGPLFCFNSLKKIQIFFLRQRMFFLSLFFTDTIGTTHIHISSSHLIDPDASLLSKTYAMFLQGSILIL
jgi:hypothetical protein